MCARVITAEFVKDNISVILIIPKMRSLVCA